ncbi:MAG: hypothetical protein Q8K36_03805, partial [Alphaproteobacteria bacterium]|nr:hypothetical protein [Alphaproteobacteria bacterium]
MKIRTNMYLLMAVLLTPVWGLEASGRLDWGTAPWEAAASGELDWGPAPWEAEPRVTEAKGAAAIGAAVRKAASGGLDWGPPPAWATEFQEAKPQEPEQRTQTAPIKLSTDPYPIQVGVTPARGNGIPSTNQVDNPLGASAKTSKEAKNQTPLPAQTFTVTSDSARDRTKPRGGGNTGGLSTPSSSGGKSLNPAAKPFVLNNQNPVTQGTSEAAKHKPVTEAKPLQSPDEKIKPGLDRGSIALADT